MQQPEEHIDAPPGIPHPAYRPCRRPWRSGFRDDFRLQAPQARQEQQEESYFQSYGEPRVHQKLIKDRVRTNAYKAAIMHHKDLISGKVVLDVGCGTGILSIFCAQAGAKRVYAVEASNIAVQARKVVTDNNLSNVIVVLHERLEDVHINEKVDVIVSEWMGYMLLYENMLASVITARDRWLKPGGLILPSKATLYMAPFTNTKRYQETVDFWCNVYGIDMSAMLPLAKQCAFTEPSVETITDKNVLARPNVVKCVNCHSITIPELECVKSLFMFNSMVRAPLHGFAFWFDVEFTGPILSPNPIRFQLPTSPVKYYHSQKDNELLLSTEPEALPTHWEQTLIYFHDPIELEQGQVIKGGVTLSRSQECSRILNIEISYATGGRSYVKMAVMK